MMAVVAAGIQLLFDITMFHYILFILLITLSRMTKRASAVIRKGVCSLIVLTN